jgi:hypothetical protein
MDLISPSDNQVKRDDGGVTLLPALDEEGDGNDTKTQVQVLDLPLDRFLKICPRKEDMLYLAHLRCVDPCDKVPLNMHAVGDFSVLVANRFPQPGSNVVFLVSLEGGGDLLDDPKELEGDREHMRVRLVLLDSWSFNDDEAGVHTFGELMKGLDVATFGVKSDSDNDGETEEDHYVKDALGRGYVPVEYQPWNSTPTFGWYRGPLSPTRVDGLGGAATLFHRADAALIFDETTGVFDLSYAAAWQLGRMTALAAPSVAQELRQFHDTSHDAFDAATELENFLEVHGSAVGRVWQQEKVSAAASVDPGQDDSAAPDVGATPDGSSEIQAADTLLHFLARLALLYPVPCEYLLAHGKLLPPASMRFFHLDNNWLDALIEGALSIALDCDRDGQVKVTARKGLHEAISQLVYQYRRHVQGLDKLDPLLKPSATYIDDPKTGFLLRSDAISGWPGLEVACYDEQFTKMPVLRMEHLGSDLLFCMASGVIKHVVIKEPGEGLRFGLDDEHAVMLRNWKKGTPGAPIEIDNQEQKLTVYLQRADAAAGVLDVKALADALAKNVAGLEGSSAADFGPAAFALQMTRSPEKQQIDVGQHTDKDMIEDK